MKKITLLLSLYAAASLISCSKTDSPAAADEPQSTADAAYVELIISTPEISTGSSVTRAEGDEVAGTEEESGVTSVLLLTFDESCNYVGAYSSSTAKNGTTYSFEVDPSIRGFFAIVNPTDQINESVLNITSGNAWDAVYPKLNEMAISITDVSTLSGDNAFTMVNAGTYQATYEPLVIVSEALSMYETLPTVVTIPVDRLVAKFTYSVSSSLNSTDASSITTDAVVNGVKLNATNKTTYIYSTINKLTATQSRDYRKDANMDLDYGTYGADCLDYLNWLHNYDDNASTFWASTSQEYVLENTANSSHHDYNNLTQAIVKATFTPSDLSLTVGTSWFVIDIEGEGETVMTFAQVQEFYNNEASAASKTKMDTQLSHILDVTSTWDAVELTDLDAIPNGGYKAATVDNEEDYIVQYFQGGINYYDIFIQHDDAEAVGSLGRWGMVRNNSYALTIGAIKAHGFPYIPDPTDEDIKDPQNPDVEDPEPADPENAFIEAYISVNPWTTWTQESDLL